MSNADNLKEEFIDLQANQGCKTKFRASSLSHFWCDQLIAYPGLARVVLEMITSFPTTYLLQEGILDNAANQDNCPEPSSWRPVTQHEHGSGNRDATI